MFENFFDLIIFWSFLSVLACISGRYVGWLFFILGTAIFLTDAISLVTTEEHLTIQALAHFGWDSFVIAFKLTPMLSVAALTLSIVLIVGFIVFYNKLVFFFRTKNKKFTWCYLILSLLCIIAHHDVPSAIRKTVTQYYFTQFSTTNLNETISALGGQDFIYPESIKAKQGKNVVIIYLESFEDAFFKRKEFKDLVWQTQEIRKQWNTFSNYQMVDGSTWTISAIYATQTGLPMLVAGMNANNQLQNLIAPRYPSIYSILNKAGYVQTFLTGSNKSFAGKGNFLLRNGVDKVIDRDTILLENPDLPLSPWGIYDMDLLNEAKKEYLRLKETGKPFSLSLLTTDLHFPSGHQDSRLRHTVPIANSLDGLQYSLRITDHLLHDFLSFLRQHETEDNLAIFVLPDHEMMGTEAINDNVKILSSGSRGLWFTTNIHNIKGYEQQSKPIYCWDIPQIILTAAGIETNVRFGQSLFPQISPVWIKDHHQELSRLTFLLNSFKDESQRN